MKLKLVVADLELSARQKRTLAALVGAAILSAAAVASAGPLNLHIWSTNDILTADDLNGTFAALETAHVGLDGRVATLEAKVADATVNGTYSIGSTYCGATPTTTGDLSGLAAVGTSYPKARAECQTTCSSPTAHMCVGEEVSRTVQLGTVVPAGWYSAGAYAQFNGVSSYECFGFTDPTGSQLGPIWNNAFFSANYCNVSYPVLCCD